MSPVFGEGDPKATPPKVQDDPIPVLAVPQAYHYDVRGRRDPFLNPVPKPVNAGSTAVIEPQRPPGLKVSTRAACESHTSTPPSTPTSVFADGF